ncbi:MAG TPA: hypothetical protein PK629_00505 [Oscillospiraceae bacterium]|nr:hypothetical protein [Oscillospiraceae bacterium]HPK36378.1 hypothetical protein [Oscillospiraceae bacterium]HPR75754.1 hypothetical protein [Oscillospiraceae bacterium]
MNPAIYIGVFLPLLVILLEQQQTYAQMMTLRIVKRKARKEGIDPMNESVKQFIGKSCMIYTYNNQMTGTVVSIEENWMTIKTKSGSELINLDYISRIREHPAKKRG